MNDPVWTLEPALLVERIATVLPAATKIVLIREPVRQVQIVDTELAVVLRAVPQGDGWLLRTWVAEYGLDQATTELALEVLAVESKAAVDESLMFLDDVLRAHSSSALKPATLWSYLRRAMERARLTFDTSTLRGRIPALEVHHAFVGPAKVQLNGVWEGYAFEFRVQYGSAALKVTAHADSAEPLWFAGMYFDKWDSLAAADSLPTWPQIETVFVTLASRIERAPFVYMFRRVSPSDDEAPWESSGQSAEDAFENLLSRVSRLREQGYLSGADNGVFYPQPLNVDLRQFPAVQPKFEVRP